MTEVLPSRTSEQRAKAVIAAVELLRSGEIVAVPTETVYGLAADALNPEAVAKIYEAKERPSFDPLIVHLPDRTWLDRIAGIAADSRNLVEKLVAEFWPGPFTIVLRKQKIVPDLVTAGLDTVAVRISANPVFAEIIGAFASPVAAPSANRFGRISPTTAQHAFDELNGRIALIIDGGPTPHGIESTIVAVRNGRIELLRPGPITAEQLGSFGEVVATKMAERPEAPGQLSSHYTPRTRLLLVDDALSFTVPANKRCGLLAWRSIEGARQFAEVRHLSSRQDQREAAANLFRCLRELDQLNLDLLVAERLPEVGLGAAIMDRLRRASAGRPEVSKSEDRNPKQT